MDNTALDGLGQYDCVLIVIDHGDYDFKRIVAGPKLVVGTTRGIRTSNVVHC